ncbi:MAG: hypothetical protein PVI88_07400, partial [Nitrosopumilaceae archaeon]
MGEHQIKFVVIVFEKYIFVVTLLTKYNFKNFQNLKPTNIFETTTQNYFSIAKTCIPQNIFQKKIFMLINHYDQLGCKGKLCDNNKRNFSSLILLSHRKSTLSKHNFVCSQELNYEIKNHVVIVNYQKNIFIKKLIQKNYQKNKNTITCKLKLDT